MDTKRESGKRKIEVKVEPHSEDDEECQVIHESVSKEPRLEVGPSTFELHSVPKDVPTTMRMWPMMFSAIVKELTPPVELRDQGPPRNDPYLWSMLPPVPQLRHTFSLTDGERRAIKRSWNGVNKYSTQVRLRFCIVPDPESIDPEPDDWYPEGLTVYVNGTRVEITTKAGKTNSFKPLDITNCVNFNGPTNVVQVYWSRNHDLKVYAMNTYLCKELTIRDLFRKLCCYNEWSPPEKSLQWIKDIVWNREDDAVISLVVSVSTMCQFTKKPLKFPCRGVNCVHPTCFDMLSFLHMNAQRKQDKTFCPYCNKPLKMEDLRIDELFGKVLKIIQGSKVEIITIHKEDSVDDVLERVQAQVRQQSTSQQHQRDEEDMVVLD